MLDSDRLSECIDFMTRHFPNWKILLNTERRRYWYIIASYINATPVLRMSVSSIIYSDKLNRFAYLAVILERFDRSFKTKEKRKHYLNLFLDSFAEYRYDILTEIRSEIESVPKELTEQEEGFGIFTRLPSSSLESIINIILEDKRPYEFFSDERLAEGEPELDLYINLIGSDESYRYEEHILNEFIYTISRSNHLYVLIDKNFDEDIITTRDHIYSIKEHKDCVILKYHGKSTRENRQIEFYSGKVMDLPCPVIHLQPYKYKMIDEWKIINVFKSIFPDIPITPKDATTVKDTVLEYEKIEYKKGIPAVSFTNSGINCPVMTGRGKGKVLYSRVAFLHDFYDDVLTLLGIENKSNHLIVSFIEKLFDIEFRPDVRNRHIYPTLNQIKGEVGDI